MHTLPVIVRLSSGTYHAKVLGKPYKCTCTSGEDNAAVALASKFYGDKAQVRRVRPRHDEYAHSEVANADLSDAERRECEAKKVTHLIVLPIGSAAARRDPLLGEATKTVTVISKQTEVAARPAEIALPPEITQGFDSLRGLFTPPVSTLSLESAPALVDWAGTVGDRLHAMSGLVALFQGAVLAWVKEEMPHGNFTQWVKDHCSYGYVQANQRRKLFEAVRAAQKGKSKARLTFDPAELAKLPFAPPEEQERILRQAEKLCAGRSFRQLTFDFTAPPDAHDRKGAAKKGKATKDATPEPTAEDQAKIAYESARAEWKRIAGDLEAELNNASLPLLKKTADRALIDRLARAFKDLSPLLKNLSTGA